MVAEQVLAPVPQLLLEQQVQPAALQVAVVEFVQDNVAIQQHCPTVHDFPPPPSVVLPCTQHICPAGEHALPGVPHCVH